MSSTPNTFPRVKGHKPDCMCATCEYPAPNSPRRLSPIPAQESQGESIAAPAEAGQGQGTVICAASGSTNRIASHRQNGGAFVLLLALIVLLASFVIFFDGISSLDAHIPCRLDQGEHMNCKLEQGV